jgi:hypothetical protein
MDRDLCIITGYCLIQEQDRHLTAVCLIRHGGFAPQLSDVEVVTRAIGVVLFKLSRNTDLCASCQVPSRSFFPERKLEYIEVLVKSINYKIL